MSEIVTERPTGKLRWKTEYNIQFLEQEFEIIFIRAEGPGKKLTEISHVWRKVPCE